MMYPKIDHNCAAYGCHNARTSVGNASWEFLFCPEHQGRLRDGEALFLGSLADVEPIAERIANQPTFKVKGKVGIGGDTEVYGMRSDVETPLKDLSPYN